ncbi:MAG: glutamate 5-kinase [Clostridiaceae bacterium]|nr:glutamate 5-kinase [Clostridiaceae bacterium]
MLDLKACRRVVVKVGTSSLTYETGRLNLRRVEKLARALSDLKNFGREIVLVTSGAVGAGVARLGLEEKPHDVRLKQAAAAVGQSELMNVYGRFFGEYGHTVAQLLLTRDVVDTPEKKQNVTNTFETLLKLGAIPIVNENDTVSTYELEHVTAFGDNDTLAAVCAQLISADLLILLSDIDGLYDADPRTQEEARRIPVVYRIDDELMKAAGGEGTKRGTGGMATKLNAAKLCMEAGIPMVIASGENPDIVCDILDGRHAGTVFMPKGREKA